MNGNTIFPRYDQGPAKTVSRSGELPGYAKSVEAQGMATLADRIGQFKNTMMRMAGQTAQAVAADQAHQDFASMQKQIADIRIKYAGNPERMDEELRKVTSKAMTESWSIYGRAYNTAIEGDYVNSVTTDATAAAFEIARRTGDDPEAFKAAFSSYQKEFLKSAPSNAAAVAASETYNRIGLSTYKRLYQAKFGEQKSETRKDFEKSFDSLSTLYRKAMRENDTIGMTQILTQAKASLWNKVNDQTITEAEAQTRLDLMQQDAALDYEKFMFEKEIEHYGDPYRALDSFMQRRKSGGFNWMDQKAVDEVQTFMTDKIKESNDRATMKIDHETQMDDRMKKRNYSRMAKDAAAGTLTVSQVREYEANGWLDPADADRLEARISYGDTRKESDKKTLTLLYTDEILVDTPENVIMEHPLLAEKDKVSLLNRRENLLATRFNWYRSDEGKQAIAEIKNHYGIFEGSIILKRTDIDNENGRRYAATVRKLYDRVHALPEDEQSKNVLRIAREILEEEETEKRRKKEEYKKKRDEEKWKKAEDLKKAQIGYGLYESTGIKMPWIETNTTVYYEEMNR